MDELVQYTADGDVAVLTLDNPPVNAMTPGVAEALVAAVERAAGDSAVRAIVLIAAGKTFMAGADIKDFADDESSAKLLNGFARATGALENCAKPVVAAIHGSALGGGLELAMSAHYRVMLSSAQVGQPEVKLGLIPGAGGTQRLPRLAGVAKALKMCFAGNTARAAEALASGIVDQVVEADLLDAAVKFARDVAGKPVRRTCDRNEKLADLNPGIFSATRERAVKTMRGQPAPLAAIDAVEAAATLPFTEGLRREAELFEQCRRSTPSKALIHLFFAERAASKIPGLPMETPVRPIERAAIVGAGTMGGGIAMALADAGVPVILKEVEQAALDRGIAAIRANYTRSLKSGRLSAEAMEQRLARITPQLSYDGFNRTDLIIEAVFENLEVKKQVFVDLGRVAGPDCILATNTSSLDVDAIAGAGGVPERTLGLHFFSPANIMRLVEVVRGRSTSHTVLATAMALTKRLNKIAVLSGNAHGFIGNRMIEMYGREAQFLVEEGTTVEQVNQALYDFGMPMGPLAMYDLVGNDVMRDIERGSPMLSAPGSRKPVVIERLLARARLGQKSGAGWSKYDENRKASPDPDVNALIEAAAREAGIERREIDAREIVDRCVFALVNEGARILAQGVALRASDIDVVYATGYGFPAWRGGPMFYADTLGLKHVLARILEFHDRHGDALWTPAPLLRKLAESEGGFVQWDGAVR